jgi:hypothetical protein
VIVGSVVALAGAGGRCPSWRMRAADLVVILHERDRLDRPRYFLHDMVERWRGDGMEVHVHRGPDPRVEAPLALLHVNLTRTPKAYLAAARRYPRVINGEVTDISKRRISTGAVARRDGHPGPVIVKTDRNYDGRPELNLELTRRSPRRMIRAARNRLPWPYRSHGIGEYPIFEAVDAVPRVVWRNRHLVVEQFRPERAADGSYCLRTWMFLGSRQTHSLSYATGPVVKSRDVVRREVLGEVPAELQAIRRRLGFEFGKFDYVLVDGAPVLYDANRTPTLGEVSPEVLTRLIPELAAGIADFR